MLFISPVIINFKNFKVLLYTLFHFKLFRYNIRFCNISILCKLIILFSIVQIYGSRIPVLDHIFLDIFIVLTACREIEICCRRSKWIYI